MAQISILKFKEINDENRIDAEFYKEIFIENEKIISKHTWSYLNDLATKITDGSHITPNYKEDGIPFLMVRNIGKLTINFDDVKFIDSETDKLLKGCKPKEGDILLTKVGTLGRVAIVPKDKNFNIFVSLAILKEINKINKHYLAVFLLTKNSYLQFIRYAKGISQPDLHLEDIRKIKVPIPSEKFQEEIEKMAILSQKNIIEAERLYNEAEKLLISEFGLEISRLKSELTYVKKFKEIDTEKRFDAEFYQPKFNKLIELIKNKDSCFIKDILLFNNRGVQPNYAENGDVKVVTSQHIGEKFIDYENFDTTIEKDYLRNSKAQIKEFDILIYTTGANIGRANCFLEKEKALASNHVNILRVKELKPAYVALFLNSILGQLQVKKYMRGTAQAELYPEDIANFRVWKAPNSLQTEISNKMITAQKLRKESKKLLEEAIRKVEEFILK